MHGWGWRGLSEEHQAGARRGMAIGMGCSLQRVRGGDTRDGAMGGGAGEARTATSAKPPLGSIAMPTGYMNLALPPAPSRKPAEPLPASVVVAPVARSTRRTRWLPRSCDASWEDTLSKES